MPQVQPNGEILLKSGAKPESVAILHCIGSRDDNYKQTLLTNMLHALFEVCPSCERENKRRSV